MPAAQDPHPFQVVVMGLAYLTPMAVISDTFAIVGDITDGRVGHRSPRWRSAASC